jgi:hypothetical protein
MPRGRPRKRPANAPAHIDYSKVPKGIYWDASGSGRWYVKDPDPETGRIRARTVAQASACMSDLHVIAEQRRGEAARGTLAYISDAFQKSLDWKDLADTTQKGYLHISKSVKSYPLKNGMKLGDILVDRLTPGGVRRIIDVIAAGRPAERPGEEDAPPYPTKANHWLRYLRRTVAWGIEHDLCKTNPFRGVRTVKERKAHRMPELTVFRAVQSFARERGAIAGRAKGSVPPYIWAAMEIGYQARLRGIEVLTLTDAHVDGDRLQTNRRKGSRDNLVRKGSHIDEAIAALQAYRTQVWERRNFPRPMRPDQRFLFVGEDGEPLTRSGFNTSWGRMIRAAVKAGVLTEEQRFALHGLKHRGITDTKGDKQKAAGHVTPQMTARYDHELPEVEPANDAYDGG